MKLQHKGLMYGYQLKHNDTIKLELKKPRKQKTVCEIQSDED